MSDSRADVLVIRDYVRLKEDADKVGLDVQWWNKNLRLEDEDGRVVFESPRIWECAIFCKGYASGKKHYEVNP